MRACIHCLSTIGECKIPRTCIPAVHGTELNNLLQFDYIELGPGSGDAKNVRILRDDHSVYTWGFSFPGTSAENAAAAIID